MDTVNPALPLPTLLSQALVAHTIELDNEAEHRLPHRTTQQGKGDAPRRDPWLVSFSLWANVLQYLEDDPVSVAELPPSGQPLQSPPQSGAVVRSTPACRRAQEVWAQLPAVIDDRWRSRVGGRPVGRGPRAGLRRVVHRSPGLSPGHPSHPERQGRTGAA